MATIYPPIEKLHNIGLKAEVQYMLKIKEQFDLDENNLAKMLGVDRKTVYNKFKKYEELTKLHDDKRK